ncbi:hypothetical protein E5676_scaffold109G00260 [Cucumis melo var. makuwa]|uniref:DUF4216 domain-containing protein n=1 Tax=Cucumis melo var. makuwa TaxID=1194695 RepID=A0A5D3BQ15_CUCMM|nr:hypothetical protein E6C27_scaffold83G00220 [Cucumis melo var. makuwa]TYK01148.1 hypothetical protein E5676_scaffold109G00260 [Cucumis melo var. makuwa]
MSCYYRKRGRKHPAKIIRGGSVKRPIKRVDKILIDNGLAVNIMPKSTMRQLGILMDELSNSKLASALFHVIDLRTTYKLLLSRPWIHGNGVVTSTLHQCFKFYQGGVKKVEADSNPFSEAESHFEDAKFYLKNDNSPEAVSVEVPLGKASTSTTKSMILMDEKTSNPPNLRYVPLLRRKKGESPFVESPQGLKCVRKDVENKRYFRHLDGALGMSLMSVENTIVPNAGKELKRNDPSVVIVHSVGIVVRRCRPSPSAAVYHLCYGSLFMLNNFVVDLRWLSCSYVSKGGSRIAFMVASVVLRTSSQFNEEVDMFGMLNDLQAPIEHEEETEELPSEDEMSMNVGEGSVDMRWHRDKRVETDDVLRHPADAEGLKHFDSEYLDFASDPRNMRSGLALDEFNPFGQMSRVQRGINHVLYAWVIDHPSGYEVGYLSWDIDTIFQRTTCGVEYIRNKARLEGLIAEAYVINESSTFFSRYLSGIEIRFTRDERNDDTIVEDEVFELRNSANLYDDFFSLAMGPLSDVHCYNGCIMGGLRFHTVELDSQRTTQNSGVMVIGESDTSGSGDNNFYDVLDEVLHVQYPLGGNVWLFKCRWYDTDVNKSQKIHVEVGYKYLNTSRFWYMEEPVILATEAYQVFYVDDPKNGSNWKVVQVVQNKRIWDVPEVEDVENDHINVLEIVVSHQVDDHIKDDTLCRNDVDPTIVERRVVRHVMTTSSTMWMNTCHMQATTNYSDKPHIMSSSYLRNNFLETDTMFLEFEDDLDNIAGGSSSVGDNRGSSSQQPTTPTPRRCVQSRLLELECHTIDVCMQKTFSVRCIKWADIGREYIEVALLQEQSRMNKTAKQKQPYNHSSESKLFLQRQYELAGRKGKLVDRVELFRETHVRVGTFVSQATEDAHNQMLELQSQPTAEDVGRVIPDVGGFVAKNSVGRGIPDAMLLTCRKCLSRLSFLHVKRHDVILTNLEKEDSEQKKGETSCHHITILEELEIETPEEDAEDAPQSLEDGSQSTIDELKEVNLGTIEEPRPTFISASLFSEEEGKYMSLLTEHKDIFAWSYKEMSGLDPKVTAHHLAIKPGYRPIK